MLTLDPHQLEAVKWLHDRKGRGLVYADAGTGKTFIATAYAIEAGLKRALILCPATLKIQWRDEIRKFCGEESQVIDGPPMTRTRQWKGERRFTIANYELIASDYDAIVRLAPDGIFADESHYVNSPVAKRTKAFKEIQVPVRVALSGDPFPNGPWEAFSVIDWIRPGLLGRNFWAFRAAWCVMHPHIKQAIVGMRDKEQFYKIIAPFIFRIHKEEVLKDLPPKRERYVWVDLHADERAYYEQLERELRITIKGEEKLSVTNLIALLIRLRQVVDEPEVFEIPAPASKQVALDGLLEDKVPTLVFTEFAMLAHRLAKRYDAPIIAGNIPLAARNAAVTGFQAGAHSLLVSTAAGGYGLNLTAAKRVIHFGVPYNNARVNQRVSRTWRRGQTKEVEEVFLLARKTIDEKMLNIVERKKDDERRFSKAELKHILLGN